MLQHDIHYNLTAGLENGSYWRKENNRRKAIEKFCATNKTAAEVWRYYFCHCNSAAKDMLQREIESGRPITEGFIEAMISNV